MKMFNILFLSSAVLGLSACATVGKPFPSDTAAKLVIGQTTRAQVEKDLGRPFRTGLDSGDPTFSYLYYHVGPFIEPVTKDLTVRFDARGVVKSYTYNTNSTPAAE